MSDDEHGEQAAAAGEGAVATGPAGGTDSPPHDEKADGAELWLVRHGPTEWSANGRHTGRTDIPLTTQGEQEARALAPRLAAVRFDEVLVSPLQRARRTAELAGFGHARLEPLLQEWDYGDYDGLTRAQIRETVPGWTPWTHPVPGGETLEEVAQRACTVFDRLRALDAERVLLVAHGHFLRILATRWIDAEPTLAERLALDPATISVLGHDRGTPVIHRWNDRPG